MYGVGRKYMYKFVKHRVHNYPKLITACPSRILKMIVIMPAVIWPTFAATSSTYCVEKLAMVNPRVNGNLHGTQYVSGNRTHWGHVGWAGVTMTKEREHERTSAEEGKRTHTLAGPFRRFSLSTHASSDRVRTPLKIFLTSSCSRPHLVAQGGRLCPLTTQYL